MHVHQHCALLMKNEFTNTTHPKQFQWSQTCLDKLTTIIFSSQNSTKCNCILHHKQIKQNINLAININNTYLYHKHKTYNEIQSLARSETK